MRTGSASGTHAPRFRASAAGNGKAPSAPPSVAVVDDDPAVLHALCFVLRLEGFEVGAFGNGADFLASDAPGSAACAVIDYGMEGLDGLAVAGVLRERGAMLPLVLISGTVTPRLRLLAAEAGFGTVLEKPLFGDVLAQAVTEALASAWR